MLIQVDAHAEGEALEAADVAEQAVKLVEKARSMAEPTSDPAEEARLEQQRLDEEERLERERAEAEAAEEEEEDMFWDSDEESDSGFEDDSEEEVVTGPASPARTRRAVDTQGEGVAQPRRGSMRRMSRCMSQRLCYSAAGGPDALVDLLLQLPPWRLSQLRQFWTKTVEGEYLHGVAKLSNGRRDHQKAMAENLRELQDDFWQELHAPIDLTPAYELAKSYNDFLASNRPLDKATVASLDERLELVSDQLWARADAARGELVRRRTQLIQSGWAKRQCEQADMVFLQLLQLETNRFRNSCELIAYVFDEALMLARSAIPAPLKLRPGLTKAFAEVRASAFAPWGLGLGEPPPTYKGEGPPSGERAVKSAVLGERALLLHRVSILERAAEQDRATIVQLEQELWSVLDNWIGERIVGLNHAIEGLTDRIRECVELGQPVPSTFTLEGSASSQRLDWKPPREEARRHSLYSERHRLVERGDWT